MDEQQKDSQDLTVGMDGKMTEGATQDNAVEDAASTNELAPPPEPQAESKDEGEAIEVKTTESNVAKEAPEVVESREVVTEEPPSNAEATIDETSSSETAATTPETVTPTIQEAATSAENTTASTSKQADTVPHEHRNNKKLIVAVTVLVALLLAGAAVFVYISAENNASEGESAQSTESSTVEPVTQEDIDDAVTDVEDALNSFDDTQDFNEQQLSDESLGL